MGRAFAPTGRARESGVRVGSRDPRNPYQRTLRQAGRGKARRATATAPGGPMSTEGVGNGQQATTTKEGSWVGAFQGGQAAREQRTFGGGRAPSMAMRVEGENYNEETDEKIEREMRKLCENNVVANKTTFFTIEKQNNLLQFRGNPIKKKQIFKSWYALKCIGENPFDSRTTTAVIDKVGMWGNETNWCG